jgi:dephospho-CoA kinase
MLLTDAVLMVGLTGGIGSGKSAVAAELEGLGAVVVDADRIAREVVAPGTDGFAEVLNAFGPGVLADDGTLDRATLASTVFGDNAARRRLEGIIHPRVRARSAELAAKASADAVVVNDVPLLVESGLGAMYHLVIVVRAAPQERIARLVRGRGMTQAEAQARIAAQADDAQRAAVADVILPNDGTLAELAERVRTLWTERLRPYEENVRLRRVQPSSGKLVLVPPDPTWPTQYARLAARLARAAGPVAERIDHIGSTAVPGLPAKDVIDIQLTVASLAEADSIADALGGAGFPRLPGQRSDNPKPADGGDVWRKRMHGSADPGRRANVHVRVGGSPGWRYALLMRDYLRAEPAVREEYAALKAKLAATGLTRAAYLDAKEPWFTALWPRMQAWAKATNWTAR